jgi:hypothetical protein
MSKTRLTNALRQSTCNKILESTFRERELRLEQREHALALRVLRRELGEGALIRIAALPPGWLPLVNQLVFENEKVTRPVRYQGYHTYDSIRSTGLKLAQSMPVPSFVSHNKLEIGAESIAEIAAFVEEVKVLAEEHKLLRQQVLGTLGGFFTVEAFAEGWPEGYTHFPHPEMAPDTLPAHRIEDTSTFA